MTKEDGSILLPLNYRWNTSGKTLFGIKYCQRMNLVIEYALIDLKEVPERFLC
jgi:hypothetical protein